MPQGPRTMNLKSTQIEISKEYLNFSVGHFTIFSKSHRENLHGHNYRLAATIDAPVEREGLTFDYNLIKKTIKALCDEIDEQVLLPSESPYLDIEEDNDYVYALFNSERLPFLKRDVTVLPISNVTVEELSHYFLYRFLEHETVVPLPLTKVVFKCSSGDGQWASSQWVKGE